MAACHGLGEKHSNDGAGALTSPGDSQIEVAFEQGKKVGDVHMIYDY